MNILKVPDLGGNTETAVITRWIKRRGDAVVGGEAIAELETNKITLEVSAPEDGVIGALFAEEGAEVGSGSVLACVVPKESQPKFFKEQADRLALQADVMRLPPGTESLFLYRLEVAEKTIEKISEKLGQVDGKVEGVTASHKNLASKRYVVISALCLSASCIIILAFLITAFFLI